LRALHARPDARPQQDHPGCARGPVLEIGPYLGGSTVAIASGIREAGGGPLVTIEGGTSYEEHPHLPSKDIIGDLRKNLAAFGVSDIVQVVIGYSPYTPTRRKVRRLLQPHSVGLLVVDANGFPGTDLWLYERYLKDGCVLVFDDYETDQAPEKSQPVKRWITRAIQRSVVTDLGVYLWGTWVGQYRRPPYWKRLFYRVTDVSGTRRAKKLSSNSVS
jgi:predicted O-methyltransferase YrrM